jgi:hypothetical protein
MSPSIFECNGKLVWTGDKPKKVIDLLNWFEEIKTIKEGKKPFHHKSAHAKPDGRLVVFYVSGSNYKLPTFAYLREDKIMKWEI